MSCRIIHATASQPGAIAIIQLVGDCSEVLRRLTGVSEWPLGCMRLCNFADIDQGIAARLGDEAAQIMPHGGPRIIQLLIARLMQLGCELADAAELEPTALFPEAQDEIEALMLAALARAASPLAIDLLLDQPQRWRDFHARGKTLIKVDRERSARLNRLVKPPLVVLAGRPNVGKSTLSNALLGRSMSIALDMPGTTRDYTAGRIDLGGIAVDWFDTPGLRETSDQIERKAIEIATRLIDQADVLVAMRDPASDWPPLPRPADVFVLNKTDTLDSRASIEQGTGDDGESPLLISAAQSQGIEALVRAVSERLAPSADREHEGPWLFDERLMSSPCDHSRLSGRSRKA